MKQKCVKLLCAPLALALLLAFLCFAGCSRDDTLHAEDFRVEFIGQEFGIVASVDGEPFGATYYMAFLTVTNLSKRDALIRPGDFEASAGTLHTTGGAFVESIAVGSGENRHFDTVGNKTVLRGDSMQVSVVFYDTFSAGSAVTLYFLGSAIANA